MAEASWDNSTLIAADVAARVAELKQSHGGEILVNGSATVVRTLADADLVDEYRLMLFPTILGRGLRLFAEGLAQVSLKLADSRPLGPDGVLLLTYAKDTRDG